MRIFSLAFILMFTGAIFAEDALDLVKQLKNPDNEERRKAAQKLFELKEEATEAFRGEGDEYIGDSRYYALLPGSDSFGFGVQESVGDCKGVRGHGVS